MLTVGPPSLPPTPPRGACPARTGTQDLGRSLRLFWLKSGPLDFGQHFLDLYWCECGGKGVFQASSPHRHG